MASPFYVQMPDLFGGQMAARQAAQQDFANKLSQLYAGGNQQAGQALAGVAPDKADAIRAALEKLPGTEQAKVRQRTDLLKKWHYAIAQEPDESRRALMWNQMLGQAQQSGANISGIAQSYSPEALQSQTQELLSFEELMGMQKERRLAEGSAREGVRAIERGFLAEGDPGTQQWQDAFFDRYEPRPNQFGYVQAQPIPRETLAKALYAGVSIPSDWLTEDAAQFVTEFKKQTTLPPGRLPGEIKQGGISPPSIKKIAGMKTAEELAIEKEDRAESRKREEEARQRQKEAEQGTAYTADQQKSAGFAARMDQSGRFLSASGDYVPSLKDLIAYRADPTGFAGSEKSKLYLQAQENWLSANLRKESGAVIGEDEMAREAKKYFPQPGDSPAVIAQKKEARKIAEEAMRQSGGGAYTQLSGKLRGGSSAPAGGSAYQRMKAGRK